MIYRRKPLLVRLAPAALQRHVMHFEAEIEAAVRSFADTLADGALVLDAGAGETQYASLLGRQRYIAVDLAVGDLSWSYAGLSAFSRLENLPFRSATFYGCLNIVTLEHVMDPLAVLREIARTLKPNAPMLLVTPLDWEEHQVPHDYYRYTRYGLAHLLREAGFDVISLSPVGGFFRLLSRRLWNSVQFSIWLLPLIAIPALLLPLLDRLDRERRFTLGHICLARKS